MVVEIVSLLVALISGSFGYYSLYVAKRNAKVNAESQSYNQARGHLTSVIDELREDALEARKWAKQLEEENEKIRREREEQRKENETLKLLVADYTIQVRQLTERLDYLEKQVTDPQ